MKNYEDMAKAVLKARDEYIKKKRKRILFIKKASAVSFGAAAILGIGICANALKPPKKPTANNSGIITNTTEAVTTSAGSSVQTSAKSATTQKQTITTSVLTTSPSTKAVSSEVQTIAAGVNRNNSSTSVSYDEYTVGSGTQTPISDTSTQTTTTEINQGGIDMKKISAFITALTLTVSLSPENFFAEASNGEKQIMFTQSELYQFKCYGNELSPDINGDEVFDICDVFELKLYSDRFCECFEKYGYDQSKYTELSKHYSQSACGRILKCYNAEGEFTFMPVGKEGAEYLTRYYLYLNGTYPSDDEIYSSLQNRAFFTTANDEDIAEFLRYINELRESIIYADDYDTEKKFSDEQLEAFARFDKKEINADINRDGVVDFMDGYDVLIYSVLKNNMGQTSENNEYLSEETWKTIEKNGDVTLDGTVDEKDYELLMSYYYRNTINPSITRDDCINRIVEHLKKKNESSGYANAEALYASLTTDEKNLSNGDANCDGQTTVADAVAILQFIGNRDKYELTEQGKLNADVDGEEGVTANDALTIQQWDSQGKL